MLQVILGSWWIYPLLMTLLVGILCPVTGALLITQGRLLQANLISHGVVPGLVLAFAIGIDPSLGGIISGLIGALTAERLALRRKEYGEAVINTVLAGSLGFGVLLIPLLKIRIDLESILFGDLLAAGPTDIIRVSIATSVLLLLLKNSYQNLIYLGLDPEGAASIGLRVPRLKFSIAVVTSLVIVSSMSAVGVILVIALLAAPGLLGLNQAQSLNSAMIRSAGYGLIISFIGFLLAIALNLSPGPLIAVLCLFSLILSDKYILSKATKFLLHK